MKKNLFCLFILLFSTTLFAQDMYKPMYERHWKKNVQKVRVMSYNIFNGFDWCKDLEREARMVSWIKEQDPEVLGLQELCGFTQERLQKLAAKWGHPYAIIVKEDGYPVGITSKRPIVLKSKLVGEIGHGLLHVQTYGLDFLVTHLNPSNTTKRNNEAQKIVEYITEKNLVKCILMGDMNSHSPMDVDFLDSHATLLTTKYGGAGSSNLLNGGIDYSVISRYLSLPLIDVCRKFVAPGKRTTFPTPILMDQSKQVDVRIRTSERLDYIFVTPQLESYAVDAYIFNEGKTEYLSDHFPIAVDFCIESSMLESNL